MGSVVHFSRLLKQFAGRDLASQLRGTWLGWAWLLLTPLLLLAVFTLVFNGLFKMKWPQAEWDSPAGFAMFTFCGLLLYQFLAEVLPRACDSIVSQKNLVTKVVFPVWVLPLSIVLSSLVKTLFGLLLFLGVLLLLGKVTWSWLWLPLVLLPLVLALSGSALLLASLGVYIRDLMPVMTLFVTLMMFVSPIFYPLSAISGEGARWLLLNPFAVLIGEVRRVLLLSDAPVWSELGYVFAWALGLFVVGVWAYRRLRGGFADVL